jgi:hypothetical protein
MTLPHTPLPSFADSHGATAALGAEEYLYPFAKIALTEKQKSSLSDERSLPNKLRTNLINRDDAPTILSSRLETAVDSFHSQRQIWYKSCTRCHTGRNPPSARSRGLLFVRPMNPDRDLTGIYVGSLLAADVGPTVHSLRHILVREQTVCRCGEIELLVPVYFVRFVRPMRS